eukprot:TRINITY_DN4383_c0_g2_i1.p1 TRINITY_DN4383_c0_g2~~TRINITY_DN4383_c0_g2_i1.p1  ORF type:complete len:367 (+),score=70.50 TRINITY_DN4383_c0_g2_i1:70-1170(+)
MQGTGDDISSSSKKRRLASVATSLPSPSSSSSSSSDALRIDNLRRPFTEDSLRLKLETYGTLQRMWLNSNKSRCYIVYSTRAESDSAIESLDGCVWPPHPDSSALRVSPCTIDEMENAVHSSATTTADLSEPLSHNKRNKEGHPHGSSWAASLFPPTQDHDASPLYDDEALVYLTPHKIANKTTNWAMDIFLSTFGDDLPSLRVVDATAGVGGDTLALASHPRVGHVTCFEPNKGRYDMLTHNIAVYGHNNDRVVPVHGSFLKHVLKEGLSADLVVVDPPWGGKDYKYRKCIPDLYLSDDLFMEDEIGMGLLVQLLFSLNKCKMVVLKLPFNFDDVQLRRRFKNEYVFTKITDRPRILFMAIVKRM